MNLHSLIGTFSNSLALPLPNPPSFPLEVTVSGIVMTLEYEEERPHMLVIYRTIGIVPVAREMEIYEALLDANLFWRGTGDATIGVHSDTLEVIIAYRFDHRHMQAEDLTVLAEQFGAMTDAWRRYIEEPGNVRPTGLVVR